MSYCRFNFDGPEEDPRRSDVYCYRDVDGPYVVRRSDDTSREDLPTAEACRDRLIELRGLGYRVPQYAIDDLAEEAAALSP